MYVQQNGWLHLMTKDHTDKHMKYYVNPLFSAQREASLWNIPEEVL